MVGWLGARSIARGLPAPIADRGGWRVDTGLAEERQRYVFAHPSTGLAELGRSVTDRLVVLKLCAASDVMRHWLRDRWMLDGAAALMTCDGMMNVQELPPGYRLELRRQGQLLSAIVTAADHSLAASGHAAEHAGVFAFDRIVTEPAHRRRGLGAVIMTTLAGARVDRASRFVLVATPEGRALYESLGWRIEAPYTTARLR